MQYIVQSPDKGLVDVVDEVGGEDDDAWEPLNVVEQHTHIHIGIVVRGGAGGGGGGGGGREGRRKSAQGKQRFNRCGFGDIVKIDAAHTHTSWAHRRHVCKYCSEWKINRYGFAGSNLMSSKLCHVIFF